MTVPNFLYLLFKYFLNSLIRSNRVTPISCNRLYIQPWNGYEAEIVRKKGCNQKRSYKYKNFHYFIHDLPFIIRPRSLSYFSPINYFGINHLILKQITAP